MAKKKTAAKTVDTKDNNLTVFIFSLILVLLLGLAYFKAGAVGNILNNLFNYLFGYFYPLYFIFLFICLIFTSINFFKEKVNIKKIYLSLLLITLACFLLEGILNNPFTTYTELGKYIKEGFNNLNNPSSFSCGLIASFLYITFINLFARTFTIIIDILIFMIGIGLLIPLETYQAIGNKFIEDINDHKRRKTQEKEKSEQDRLFSDSQQSSFNNIDIEKDDKNTKKSLYDISADEDKAIPLLKEENNTNIIDTATNKTILKEGEYKLPPISLLDKPDINRKSNINQTSADIKGDKIIEILNNFNIKAKRGNTYIGPSVTKFEIQPDSSVKINKILTIQDNIKMELAAKDIRIEAPIPGRSYVGIEIPNASPQAVYMREIIDKIPSSLANNPLLIALGKDLMGKAVFCELNKMPHLLIAGATGAGKSVCINSIIMSLIMRNYPDDIKLILIDPKKVEFTPYHNIPHLFWPVITDVSIASSLLQRIVTIMDERYDAFAAVGVRKIDDYNSYVIDHNQNFPNESKLTKMPYMVVIIDELADMMALAGKEVELSIQRITQLARACGIHLIVATQRPSTDVITGIIKANIPSRISFAVASSIDSRTILDRVGAERLLGNGDMLYYPGSEPSPIRVQGVYVRDDEIKRVTDFLKKEASPAYDDAYYELQNINKQSTTNEKHLEDALMPEVIEYIKETQKASTSLLQRRFGIGYNRAARLIDALEEAGYIGQINGSKPREVYLKKEENEQSD